MNADFSNADAQSCAGTGCAKATVDERASRADALQIALHTAHGGDTRVLIANAKAILSFVENGQ